MQLEGPARLAGPREAPPAILLGQLGPQCKRIGQKDPTFTNSEWDANPFNAQRWNCFWWRSLSLEMLHSGRQDLRDTVRAPGTTFHREAAIPST